MTLAERINALAWGGDSYPAYDGLLKGADEANKQRKEELQMQKDAFAMQMQQLKDLNARFSKYTIGQGEGFTPEQNALMQTGILNTNAQQFNSAGQGVRAALRARGAGAGDMPVGGDYVRGLSGLMGARASDLSTNLNALRIQDALQSLTNRFNAGNLMSGNAATLTGTQGVAGAGASSALNSYIQAKNTGFLSSFANSFGSSLGKTLGSFGTQSGPTGTTYGFGTGRG